MKFIKLSVVALMASVSMCGCTMQFTPSFEIPSFEIDGIEEETVIDNEFVTVGDLGDNIEIDKTESQKGEGDKITSAGQAYSTVTEVYHAVSASVVEISTESVKTSLWGQYIASGAGSGVVIEKSGLIITNYHVIEGANSVTVRLIDGDEYVAQLVAYDKAEDIAVIKIDPADKELTVAVLGCSADLEVGEDIIVLGNPLGSLGGTLTTGIISAKERNITVNGEEMVLLQTNAAINPGNSGGGLFNMAGHLVGIVNAKVAEEGIEGLGFAIPVDIAYKVVTDLIDYGYVRGKVDCGLTVLDVTSSNLPAAFQKYGINTTGVIVIESRYTSELKCGDKIVSIDGVAVDNSRELDVALRSYSVGDKVILTVVRGEKNIDVELTLREKIPSSVSFE